MVRAGQAHLVWPEVVHISTRFRLLREAARANRAARGIMTVQDVADSSFAVVDMPLADGTAQADFDTILRETEVRIRAYIAGMGIAPHEVDDVAQDVYVELYRSFHKVPPEVPIERWIKGIARNLCLNHIRRNARRGRLHREALAEILATTRSSLERSVHESSMQYALEGCCQKLPEKSRQILRLRYSEDLSSAAIAKTLNSTAEAVRVALHRIRIQLRDCITQKLASQA